MFLTQIYGTILGGFVNYAVMISIVGSNRELLVNGNGDSSWSGATMQSYNTNATSWALAKYLYKSGGRYYMIPIGLAVGAGVVILHRVVVYVSMHLIHPIPCLTPHLISPCYLTPFVHSSPPKSAASPSTKSICLSSSNTQATSLTISPRHASFPARYSLVSSRSFTYETTVHASSGITRTSSQALSTAPV